MLLDLLHLDARGGIFRQQDMHAAVSSLVKDDMDEQEQKLVAYRIRVMLRHIRNCHDNTAKKCDHPLSELLALVGTSDDAQECKRPTGSRRDERLGTQRRQTPFVHLRKEEVPDDEGMQPPDCFEVDAPEPVCCFFDNVAKVGIMLLSDGQKSRHNALVPGENGMVMCRWDAAPTLEYETEVPNVLLVDGVATSGPALCLMFVQI